MYPFRKLVKMTAPRNKNPVLSQSSVPTPSGYPSEMAIATPTEEYDATREWVRDLLRHYLGKYVRDYLSQKRDTFPSPVASRDLLRESFSTMNRKRKPTVHNSHVDTQYQLQMVDKTVKKDLTILEFKIVDENNLGDDRFTYLTRIMSLEVKYAIGSKADHCVNWLLKIPSQLDDELRLARATNVHRYETKFYSLILQDMKLWLEGNGDTEDSLVNVPTCFYAHCDDETDYEAQSDEDFLTNPPTFPNPEFTLVLEDLRAQGFGKRHFSVSLTFEEATEAVREIAKFHATSWVMLQHSGPELYQKWASVSMPWRDLSIIYLEMVHEGFRNLRKFKKFLKEPLYVELIDTLLEIEHKLPTVLDDLLRPLPPPSVTALVHMDLWSDNLLFRTDDGTAVPGNYAGMENQDSDNGETLPVKADQVHSSTTSQASIKVHYNPSENNGRSDDDANMTESQNKDEDLECMVVDWQTVGFGKITHDLALLFFSSLDAELRRSQAPTLIQFYCECFQKIANSFKLEAPFDFADIVAEYKDSCLLALLLCVARLDLVVSEKSTMERFFEGVNDLKSEGFI